MTKRLTIEGMVVNGTTAVIKYIDVLITNDEKGKTLSLIDAGNLQGITIAFEPIEQYLQ